MRRDALGIALAVAAVMISGVADAADHSLRLMVVALIVATVGLVVTILPNHSRASKDLDTMASWRRSCDALSRSVR
jgi:hypothetical protein